MSAVKEKWTARGTGKCPSCSATYSTFRKPPNCDQCNFFLGGRYVSETVSRKRRKLDNPSAVKVCTFGGNNLYSMKVTSRDDRCFCLTPVDSVITAHARAFVQLQQHLVRRR